MSRQISPEKTSDRNLELTKEDVEQGYDTIHEDQWGFPRRFHYLGMMHEEDQEKYEAMQNAYGNAIKEVFTQESLMPAASIGLLMAAGIGVELVEKTLTTGNFGNLFKRPTQCCKKRRI